MAQPTDGIAIRIEPPGLEGSLALPRPGMGIVLFAHGSGSGRFSPRNNQVAAALREAGLGTLLFDLLTEDESRDRANVFDIDLLAHRLALASAWLETREDTRGLPIGYFGASTGAAAALVAETLVPRPVGAIVSRGGRPDLAGDALDRVHAPVLLLVGGADHPVLELNRLALARLSGEKDLVVIPGAGHLFEEPGALEAVTNMARNWFATRLAAAPAGGAP